MNAIFPSSFETHWNFEVASFESKLQWRTKTYILVWTDKENHHLIYNQGQDSEG